MWLMLGVAWAGCSELKDWLATGNDAIEGFEDAYPAHLADARRYRQTALEARDISWMVESPADWEAVSEQASLAAGHAGATAQALGTMLDEVSAVGADCRKLEKRRSGLVERHAEAFEAMAQAQQLEDEADAALATLPRVEVEVPEGYDQHIRALLEATDAVAAGGGEDAARLLSAVVRELEPWELRAVAGQLPEHPVVHTAVAAALANTGDMRDYRVAWELQGSAAKLADEELDLLPPVVAAWGTVGLAGQAPENGTGGLTAAFWTLPYRRVLLGVMWERQQLTDLSFRQTTTLACFDLVGSRAHAPVALYTGPLTGLGWGVGRAGQGAPTGAFAATVGWKTGLRIRRGSFLLVVVDLELRGARTAKATVPPAAVLNVGVGWSGYRPG